MLKDRDLYKQEIVSIRSQFLHNKHPVILCNSGWYWLIVACHKALSNIDSGYRIKHIKTKEGVLDMAVLASAKNLQFSLDETISQFKALSAFVCEICADKGAIRVTKSGGYFTSCEIHAFGFPPIINPLDAMNVDTQNNISFESAADDKLNELINLAQNLRKMYEQERSVCDQIASVLIHSSSTRMEQDAAQDAYLALRSGMKPLLPSQN